MNLEEALITLRHELTAVDARDDEWAIFGSTTLVLRGIISRQPGDVDVMVSRRVWGALLARKTWDVCTPRAGDPPILVFSWTTTQLHLFFAWRDVAVEIDPSTLIKESEIVSGFRCATVEEVLRHKRAAYACLEEYPQVAKHRPDIEAIEQYLARQAA